MKKARAVESTNESLFWAGQESPPLSPNTRISKLKSLKQEGEDYIVPVIEESELDPVELESYTILKQVTPQQRYWYYIERGFPENSVHALDGATRENIDKFLPSRLLTSPKLKTTIEDLELEIKYNHVTAIKQSVVDYILIDPMERSRLHIPKSIDRYQVVTARAPVPWHDDLKSVKASIANNLFITNPVMLKLLDIFAQFESLRVVDTSVFTPSILPISIGEFQSILKSQCAVFKNRVLNEWIPTVANMFLSTKDVWYSIATSCQDIDLGYKRLGNLRHFVDLITLRFFF